MKTVAQREMAPWTHVWALYLDNRGVFYAVFADLRHCGMNVEDEDAADCIHEFLVTRAPQALGTFRPEKGRLPDWLFVVFRRFVQSQYRRRRRLSRILEIIQSQQLPPVSADSREFVADLQVTRMALSALPSDEREVLRAFFDEAGGSVRAVARKLHLTRWNTGRILLGAFSSVVLALGLEVGIDIDDLHQLARATIGGAGISAMKNRHGDVQRIRERAKLLRLLLMRASVENAAMGGRRSP